MQELNAYVANESTQGQPQPHIHTKATYYVHDCKIDNSVCNHTSHWRIQGESPGFRTPYQTWNSYIDWLIFFL